MKLLITAIIFNFVFLGSQPCHADITTGLVGWWKFDEGSGTTTADSSGKNNAGTLSGPTWVTGIRGKALNFNGTNAYVIMVNSANTTWTAGQNFSISAWINVASLDASFREVVRQSNANDGWFLVFNSSNEISFTSSGNEYASGALYTSYIGGWHNVVGTFNGSTILVYIDGIQKASYSGTGPSTNNGSLSIGSDVGVIQFFNGSIDDVRIYSRALPAGDAYQLYSTGLGDHISNAVIRNAVVN